KLSWPTHFLPEVIAINQRAAIEPARWPTWPISRGRAELAISPGGQTTLPAARTANWLDLTAIDSQAIRPILKARTIARTPRGQRGVWPSRVWARPDVPFSAGMAESPPDARMREDRPCLLPGCRRGEGDARAPGMRR